MSIELLVPHALLGVPEAIQMLFSLAVDGQDPIRDALLASHFEVTFNVKSTICQRHRICLSNDGAQNSGRHQVTMQLAP